MGANVLYLDATTNHVSLILITNCRIRDYCFFNSQIRDEQNPSFLSRIVELENDASLIRKFVMNRTPLFLSRIIELENHVSLIRKFVMNRIPPFYHEL